MFKLELKKLIEGNPKLNFEALLASLYLVTISISTTMASSDLLQVSSANARFASQFYDILSKEEPGKNIFFSPLSAHTVLALAYQGASGSTAASFSSTLNIPNQKSAANGYNSIINTLNAVENVTLHVANKVFVMNNFPLKDAFKKAAAEQFLSEAQSLDFGNNVESAGIINAWVEDKTNSKIKDLISADALDALTRLVLVNAVYFKGNWAHKFDKANTRVEPFYITNENKVDCQMMHIKEKYLYREDSKLDSKILELPYDNKDVSMVIILPNARDGIDKLEKRLKNFDLTTLTEDMGKVEVELTLPKFKIETSMDLKNVLEKMGLGVIFDQSKADFSEISQSDEQLYVSKVIQKAFIEVNEEGAEAAAATGMIMMARCMPIMLPTMQFVADHPFIIALLHKDSTARNVLFLGKIQNAAS